MIYSPTISVLMPVYNAERYIAEAVESILNQTFTDFEFLIIDDGSTDRSLEILKKYEKQDHRIRLISRPNTGLVVALNEMLALAEGEFIARMDADDISLPKRFELQINYLKSHSEILALGSVVQMVDPEGFPLGLRRCPPTHEEIEGVFFQGLGRAICHPSTMIRSKILRKLGGYREECYPAEDLDLWLRMAEVGRLANLKETLLHYRQHSQSICVLRMHDQFVVKKRVFEDMARRRSIQLPINMPGLTPPNRAQSMEEQYKHWFWMSWMEGHQATARKYALRLLKLHPLAVDNWKYALHAMITRRVKECLRPATAEQAQCA